MAEKIVIFAISVIFTFTSVGTYWFVIVMLGVMLDEVT